ncbi:MAG: PorV/PorQ family protein [Elusimicrobiota bacterium]
MAFRKNIRLKNYNYSENGYYFVTVAAGLPSRNKKSHSNATATFFIFILAFNFLFLTCLYAAGTTSGNFLKIGVGGRQSGMGEVFVGIADDVNTINYNVAGLSTIENKEFSAMHLEYFQDIRYESLNYVYPLKNSALGFSIGYLYVTGIQRTVIDENAWTAGWQYREIEKFGADDRTFFIAYAGRLSEKSDFGIGLRYVSETLDNVIAQAVSADLGYLYKFTERVNFGAALQNAGTQMKFISRRENLPVNLRAGLGYKSYAGKFTGGVDLMKPLDAELEIHTGCEYWLVKLQSGSDFGGLILRAGYRLRGFDENYKLGYLSGITAGVGFELFNYRLDYSFIPYGDLGTTHRISLLGRF